MNKEDIVTLYEYNFWANARILTATAKVTTEQFVAPANLSHGSLRGMLVHAFGAEMVWRLRCQEGVSVTTMPTEDEFLTADALWVRWQAEERAMRSYLASLSDSDLNTEIQYRNTKGAPFANILWKLLVHVVNHGTQSRAEAGIALTMFGQSPGDLDMILFFRDTGK